MKCRIPALESLVLSFRNGGFHHTRIDGFRDRTGCVKPSGILKQSGIPNRTAYMEGIEYLPDRHLNKEVLSLIRTNDYIRKRLNVMLIGATGCGKTYIACALATNACHHEYKTLYYRLNEFFAELETARIQGKYEELLVRLGKVPLMILDDFLLLPTTSEQQRDLLILMRARDENQHSAVLCSQVSVQGWHERLGSGGVADTLLDRITTNGYELNIYGDVSMRKRHSRI